MAKSKKPKKPKAVKPPCVPVPTKNEGKPGPWSILKPHEAADAFRWANSEQADRAKEAAKANADPITLKPYTPPWETDDIDEGQAEDFDKIPPKRKAIRRRFIAEYVKDHNGGKAVMRMGLHYADPHSAASKWLAEPYTQYLLDKFVEETEQSGLVTRNAIIFGLTREAHGKGGPESTGGSRVAALSKLAKIMGMEVTKVEGNLTVSGGVMMVPLAGSTEEWEQVAADAQAKLKANVE